MSRLRPINQNFRLTPQGGGGSSSIGGAIGNGTSGSVLFVDGATLLAQDNANFFWDDTLNALGLGTASPVAKLDILPNATSGASGLTGVAWINIRSATYTDNATAGAGTAPAFAFNTIQIPTLAATNAGVITTQAATVYIAGVPAAGANMTLTNAYGLWIVGALAPNFPLVLEKSLAPAATNKLISFRSQAVLRGSIEFTATDQLVIKSTVSTQLWSPTNTATNAGRVICDDTLGVVLGYAAQTLTVATATTNFNLASAASVVTFNGGSGSATYDFLQPVGSNRTMLKLSPGADTAMTLSTERIDYDFGTSTARTETWATGALATQRFAVFQASTIAFVGASTCTTAILVSIAGAPLAGANATITNAFGLQVGGATTQVSAAAFLYAAINVPAHTLTMTGTTQVTSAGPAGMAIGILTITDGSALTVNSAASLYIAGAPVQAGSVTLTKAFAIQVAGGGVNLGDATVTQGTNNQTAVTINGASGVITPFGTYTLAGGTNDTAYVVTNSACYSTSVVIAKVVAYSGTIVTNGVPVVYVTAVANGSFTIQVSNINVLNALNGTLKIHFTVL